MGLFFLCICSTLLNVMLHIMITSWACIATESILLWHCNFTSISPTQSSNCISMIAKTFFFFIVIINMGLCSRYDKKHFLNYLVNYIHFSLSSIFCLIIVIIFLNSVWWIIWNVYLYHLIYWYFIYQTNMSINVLFFRIYVRYSWVDLF